MACAEALKFDPKNAVCHFAAGTSPYVILVAT